MTRRIARAVCVVLGLGLTSACAGLFVPPQGPGQVEPAAAAIWQEVSASCLSAREFVAEVSIRGWVGPERDGIARTLSGAATRDDSLYLDLTFFGRTVLQLAARDGAGVFYLPREARVTRAPTRDIVEALTGLRWGGRELVDVLTGCVAPAGPDVSGVRVGERLRMDLGPTTHVWLRGRGAWRVEAATVDGLLIDYRGSGDGRWPERVRVTATTPVPLDLTFTLANQQVNIGLPPTTFALDVPPDAAPMSLEELRAMGPLRGQSSR